MPAPDGSVQLVRHEDGRLEVATAPPVALISLELAASADPFTFRVSGDLITLAGRVAYRVTGWDPLQRALVAELVKDRREVRGGAAS